ncbi:hypothetical protein LINPERPRIM_LOCUS15866 [Linum perenne]
MEFKELREAIEKVQLVDGHAHNIVALNSSFPFVNGFSEATGDASTFAPHSLSFKESVASACFKATGISAVLIDDGLKLHNMHKIDWHKSYFPFVGRILRIERFAEEILEQVRHSF